MSKRTCSIDGCKRPHEAVGYCKPHYQRLHIYGDPLGKRCETCSRPLAEVYTSIKGQRYCSDECKPRCSVDGCDSPVRKRGWCASHYSQWRRAGSVKPFRYKWAPEDGLCLVCDRPVPRGSRRRRTCSARCQVLLSKYNGTRPRIVECARCGASIDLLGKTRTGQFPRIDTRICGVCRRARSLRHKVSIRVLAETKGSICGICGQPVNMNLAYPDAMSPSIDHIVPYAHGGSHDIENLQVAHLRCNHVKSDRVT